MKIKKLAHTYFFYILIAIFICMFALVLIKDAIFRLQQKPVPKITHVIATKSLFATPTATPTSTPAGFCLYAPVLLYHHIQPIREANAKGQSSLTVDNGLFDQQMAYLVGRGYTTITAEQLITALRSHTGLPAKSIILTFDDAYLDNFTNAYPVLQKYHTIGNLFVPTGLLGGQGNNSYFSWDQLKQMVGSGTMTAYDHTWSHYPTGSGTIEKDQYEIMTGKSQLESNLGKTVTIFAYPYGSGQTNARVIRQLGQDGFTGAFSTIGGAYQCESYIYTLRRIRVGNSPLAAYGL